MATISQEYDDSKILETLMAVKPGLNFGDHEGRVNIEVDPPYANGNRVISVTLNYSVNERDLNRIMDASRL